MTAPEGMPTPAAQRFRDRHDEILANMRRLSSCRGPHDFDQVATRFPNGLPSAKRCSLCQGVLGVELVAYYNLGLTHGRLLKRR